MPIRVRATDKPGWYGNCFVCDVGVLGRTMPGEELIEFDTEITASRKGVSDGSVVECIDEMRKFIVASDFLALSYLCALLPPLAARVGQRQGFVVNFVGKSSTGKTLALRLCQSVFAVTGALVAISAFTSAKAEGLPKEAVALKSRDVKAIYSGKSSNWSDTRAYFAPDGSVSLFKKDKTVWAEGHWTVTSNKACMSVSWHEVKTGKAGKHTDCWTWFRHGKRYLALWSGEKDKKSGYWDGEAKLLRKGDAVTKIVATLKAGQ